MAPAGPNFPSPPLVSVCMPVYNGARFVEQAIRSVMAQSYGHFELRVFDDASTDGTWRILQGIDEPRMVLHRNAGNLGPAANWNRAMAAGEGKYIKLFHQDDLLDPDCLARQVEALEGDPDAVLTFCRRRIISPGGSQLMTRGAPWRSGPVAAEEAFRRCVLAGGNLLGEPSAVLFRAAAARRSGEFDGTIPYLIDLDYWIRLMAHGRGIYLDEPLAAFRISPRQWSAAIGRRQGRAFIDYTEKVLASGAYELGPAARWLGRARARLNGVLRVLIYRCLPEEA